MSVNIPKQHAPTTYLLQLTLCFWVSINPRPGLGGFQVVQSLGYLDGLSPQCVVLSAGGNLSQNIREHKYL